MKDWREDVNHGTCEHLDVQKCIKRTFECYDVLNHRQVNITVCNQYLGLRHQMNQNNGGYRIQFDDTVGHIISECFDVYIEDYGCFRVSELERLNSFTYTVCERPFILGRCSIKKATELFIEQHYQVACDFTYRYFNALNNLIDYMGRYKKYKYELKNAKSLLKHIERYEYNCVPEFSELFQLILTFKIYKNATS